MRVKASTLCVGDFVRDIKKQSRIMQIQEVGGTVFMTGLSKEDRNQHRFISKTDYVEKVTDVITETSVFDNALPMPVANWNMGDCANNTTVIDELNISNGVSQRNTNILSVAGRDAKAILFDGNSDYITVVNNSIIDISETGTKSWELWFKPNGIGNTLEGYIVSKTDGANFVIAVGLVDESNNTARVQCYIQHNIAVAISKGYALTFCCKTNERLIKIGAWNHLCIVYNKEDTGIAQIYANGVENNISVAAEIGWWHTVLQGTNLFFGKWNDNRNNDNTDKYCKGDIDVIRIYNEALNSNQILRLYKS